MIETGPPTIDLHPSRPTPEPTHPHQGGWAELVHRHQGLISIVIAALVVRASGMTRWWLNPDEGIYYSVLTHSDFSDFWREVASNAHPPLFYLILRFLALFSWDFLWFRAFSVACGLAAVVALAAVARELGGRGVRGTVAGIATGLLVAFAPGAVELSQVIRPYMLQLALLGGALFSLLRYLRSARARDLVAWVILITLALLTHYSSVLALGAFGLMVLHDGFWGGVRRIAWRRLAAAYFVPALVLAVLYLTHLRPLMESAMADQALDGWLSQYLIDTPGDVWLGLMGLQSLLVAEWLRGPAALLLIAAVVASVSTPDRRAALVVGTGLSAAAVAAAAGLYPFGSTRHSAWLLAFTAPALGWLAAHLATLPRRRVVVGLAGLATLVALGGPVSRLLGADRAPWPPPEGTLQRADLARMVHLLDPSAEPRLVLMSQQTFYLLMPFYPAERESAVFSADSALFHFAFGDRTVLVSRAWDFTAGDDPADPDHLVGALSRAEEAFPALGLDRMEEAVVFVGGWRPALVDQLAARSAETPFVAASTSVPGLSAHRIDVPALHRAFPSASGSRLRAALEDLVRGPTAQERAAGVESWFSNETAGVLGAVEVDSTGRAVVDFRDLDRRIAGGSSSAGSTMLLQELNATVFAFPGIRSVEYRIGGSCARFWEWLQYECRVVERPEG